MGLQFRHDHAHQRILLIEGEKAKIPPLVEEVPVYIDTVGFGQALGDELLHRGDVLILPRLFISHIAEL